MSMKEICEGYLFGVNWDRKIYTEMMDRVSFTETTVAGHASRGNWAFAAMNDFRRHDDAKFDKGVKKTFRRIGMVSR